MNKVFIQTVLLLLIVIGIVGVAGCDSMSGPSDKEILDFVKNHGDMYISSDAQKTGCINNMQIINIQILKKGSRKKLTNAYIFPVLVKFDIKYDGGELGNDGTLKCGKYGWDRIMKMEYDFRFYREEKTNDFDEKTVSRWRADF